MSENITVQNPPEGFTSLTPLFVVSPATEAISFYEKVFGAKVTTRMEGPDGAVWHAELQMPSGRFQVMDPQEAFHTRACDPSTDDVSFSVAVYVDDVDATTQVAVEAGGTLREEADDFEVTGDRFASVRDPFGVRWTIMTRKETRTDAQVQEGLDAWAASMA